MKTSVARRTALGCVVLLAACASARAPGGVKRESPLFTFEDGRELMLAVDTRAALISKPTTYLPLQVALLNKAAGDLLVAARESFVLESAGGRTVPLATADEITRNYHRQRADLPLGEVFLEHLRGRFSEPPFHYRDFDFFPIASSGTFPRDRIELRRGEMATGYLYFPVQPGQRGPAKLLFRPTGRNETYVLPFAIP